MTLSLIPIPRISYISRATVHGKDDNPMILLQQRLQSRVGKFEKFEGKVQLLYAASKQAAEELSMIAVSKTGLGNLVGSLDEPGKERYNEKLLAFYDVFLRLFYECQVFGGYLRHLRENILAYQSEFEQVQTSLDVGQPEVGRFLFIAPIAMNLRRANEFYQKMDTVFKEIQEFILARSELHEKNLHGLLNCKL